MDRSQIINLIARFEREYNIENGFLEAVVSKESSFNPSALGAAHEIGLSQLLPSGALADFEQFHEPLSDYWDIENNLTVAAWYIGKRIPQMLRHFKHPVTRSNIIIAYNWGIGRVGRFPLPAITSAYIEYVNAYMGKKKSPALLVLLLAALFVYIRKAS